MSQDPIAREAARWWLDGHDGDRDEHAFEQWRRAEAGLAVLLLCALGLYSRDGSPPAAQVLRTAAGEIRDEALPDGSHVLLSPGSEVHVRVDAQRRQLQLQRGQAWFKVSADAHRPFQVHTPHGTVTALGTAFDLAVQDGHRTPRRRAGG